MPYYHQFAEEIIIIDNNPKKRLFYDPKVKYLTKGHNVFVNPAWNWGAREATGEYLIIANDDVIIPRLGEVLTAFERSNYDIIGVDVRRCHTDKQPEILPAFQMPWGWGCFMIMRKSAYCPIPEQFKIWFGDNILFMGNHRRGSFGGVRLITEMSETLKHGFMEKARAEEPLFKIWFNENMR